MRSAGIRGLTLVEMLTASSLFLLVIFVAIGAMETASSAYKQASNTTPSFRNASVALDTIASDCRSCQQIYSPNQTSLQTGYRPIAPDPPFVFASVRPDASQVVQYAESVGGSIQRQLYLPGFSADDPTTQQLDPTSLRTLGNGAVHLLIQYSIDANQNESLKISLQSAHGDAIETAVGIPNGFVTQYTAATTTDDNTDN